MFADAPRTPFSPPPPPLDEQPDPVRLRIERLAAPDVQQALRIAHWRILTAATAGLLAPVTGIVLLLAPGLDRMPAGWIYGWCTAMALGGLAAASAMALPRRPDLIGVKDVADDGRFRPARGATAGIVAAALMACGLVVAAPVGLVAHDGQLAVSSLPWFGVLGALALAVALCGAFGMRAGRMLATLATQAASSFSAPLPATSDPASAEQRRRAVARSAESTLAGIERERHLRPASCISLSLAGGVALVAAGLQVASILSAAVLTVGTAMLAASAALLVTAAALAGLSWRAEQELGARPALVAGALSVALTLHAGGAALVGSPGLLVPVLVGVALLAATEIARWHHGQRRYADTAPSVPVLVDALFTADDAIRQPAHRLLMAVTGIDLPDEPDQWRLWQLQQVPTAASAANSAAAGPR